MVFRGIEILLLDASTLRLFNSLVFNGDGSVQMRLYPGDC